MGVFPSACEKKFFRVRGAISILIMTMQRYDYLIAVVENFPHFFLFFADVTMVKVKMVKIENNKECFVQLWLLLERTRRLLRGQYKRFCIRLPT